MIFVCFVLATSFDRHKNNKRLYFGTLSTSGFPDDGSIYAQVKFRNGNLQRFLNSGIIVGVAKEVVSVLC